MKAADKKWKRKRQGRARKLKQQQRAAGARAKFGPSGKPAPVVVKRLDGMTGEWVEFSPVDQSTLTRRHSEVVEAAARRAGWPSYEAYLHSPHWEALRRRVLERDEWRCRLCRGEHRLHVHHDRYDVDLRSTATGHLKTMCEACHRRLHRH